MQSHELDTTKPTNQFPRVIFLEELGVSEGMAIILPAITPAGEEEGMEICPSGKFHLQYLSVVGSPCNHKQE